MPPWLLKAAVQGVLSQLPEPQRWNRLFQRYVTKSLGMTEELFQLKLRRLRQHWAHWQEFGTGRAPRVLEIGTGWYPIVPIGLSLLGAEQIYTVDQQPLMGHDSVMTVVHRFRKLLDDGEFPDAAAGAGERIAQALSLQNGASNADALLDAFSVRAMVADARQLPLKAGTIDLWTSNNTFEHIPGEVIVDILKEYRRIGAPGCLNSHWIDMGDHYSVSDKSINVYNFLRFPSWIWKFLNNDLQYQNRLRLSDFRKIHEQSGWQVVREKHAIGELSELRRVPIAKELRERYSETELRVHGAWLLSQRLDATGGGGSA